MLKLEVHTHTEQASVGRAVNVVSEARVVSYEPWCLRSVLGGFPRSLFFGDYCFCLLKKV